MPSPYPLSTGIKDGKNRLRQALAGKFFPSSSYCRHDFGFSPTLHQRYVRCSKVHSSVRCRYPGQWLPTTLTVDEQSLFPVYQPQGSRTPASDTHHPSDGYRNGDCLKRTPKLPNFVPFQASGVVGGRRKPITE